MKTIKVTTLDETYALASKIALALQAPALLTMSGDLGAGKTTFTKGLAKALNITHTITSPTFTILKSYEENGVSLHHIDAYRLEGITQDLGFEEIFDDEAYFVVEWYDYINYALPEERLNIHIRLDGEVRYFELEAIGTKYETVLEAL